MIKRIVEKTYVFNGLRLKFQRNPNFLILIFVFFFFIAADAGRKIEAVEQDELSPVDFCVSGIMIDRQEPMAIINDALIKEGEEINGAKVLKILDSRVKFACKEKIFIKEIGQDCIGLTNAALPVDGSHGSGRGFNLQDFEKIRQMIPFIWGVLFLIILFYVYAAVCLQRIARKTNTENAWLAWIPIANFYLWYLIAKPAIWWFILLFIPYANIVAMAVIWMGIAEARKKPKWIGVLMLVPIVNLVAMGYLAFSE